MQLGMVGLGRMGASMVRRLLRGGHQCAVFDLSAKVVAEFVKENAVGTASLPELVNSLTKPRAVWLMVPVGAVDKTIADLLPYLERGDILIDGGNSYYVDDVRRATELAPKGIHYIDVGTSGGVWGLERGYCMMIGGETEVVKHLDPIFATLAPATSLVPRDAKRPAGRPSRATSIAGRLAPVTSLKWCITGSSTALWRLTPRASPSSRRPISAKSGALSTRKPRRSAIRNITNTISIYRTSRKSGGAAE